MIDITPAQIVVALGVLGVSALLACVIERLTMGPISDDRDQDDDADDDCEDEPE